MQGRVGQWCIGTKHLLVQGSSKLLHQQERPFQPSFEKGVVQRERVYFNTKRERERERELSKMLAQLCNPSYSPDLAPSDYFLFLQLKKHLKGNHYDSDEEVVAADRQWCREQPPEFFADGIRQLVRRWQLCVDRDGDYVEKINMRCVAEVSSFNLMYNLCMYYEKQKSYDKTELTFQPTLVIMSIVYRVRVLWSFEWDFLLCTLSFFSLCLVCAWKGRGGGGGGGGTTMTKLNSTFIFHLLEIPRQR